MKKRRFPAVFAAAVLVAGSVFQQCSNFPDESGEDTTNPAGTSGTTDDGSGTDTGGTSGTSGTGGTGSEGSEKEERRAKAYRRGVRHRGKGREKVQRNAAPAE